LRGRIDHRTAGKQRTIYPNPHGKSRLQPRESVEVFEKR